MVGWYLCWGPEIARTVVPYEKTTLSGSGKDSLVKMQQCNLILAPSTILLEIKSDAHSIIDYYL